VKRDVSAQLDLDITDPSELEFQIAVGPHPGTTITESLSFRLDGKPVQAQEIVGVHGSRIHKFHSGVGNLQASYEATVTGRAEPPPIDAYDLSVYLRPSRYAQADTFFGFAATEFGSFTGSATLLEKVSAWVGARLDYVPGSSDPIDGATDTLLSGKGVCRDYAHLVVALLRAVGVPARLVAVYAPGCDPMDFHAVAEAFVDGAWRVVDATCLAPRQSLVRIATGRDAADTAFLDNHGGSINLNHATVTAVVDGDLPYDDITELVTLG
jgi:transglutaminase-like putative cysteine protease